MAGDVVLAIAARKRLRTEAPKMPAPNTASIEQMGRIARAIKAFEEGHTLYDVIVDAELLPHRAGADGFTGTATLEVEGVLEDELEVVSARAIHTLSRGIGEQVLAQVQAAGQ